MTLFKINLIFNITNVKNKSNIMIENVCTFDNFLDLLQSNHGSPFSNLLCKISNSHLQISHQICQRCRLPKLIILQSTERCSHDRGFINPLPPPRGTNDQVLVTASSPSTIRSCLTYGESNSVSTFFIPLICATISLGRAFTQTSNTAYNSWTRNISQLLTSIG